MLCLQFHLDVVFVSMSMNSSGGCFKCSMICVFFFSICFFFFSVKFYFAHFFAVLFELIHAHPTYKHFKLCANVFRWKPYNRIRSIYLAYSVCRRMDYWYGWHCSRIWINMNVQTTNTHTISNGSSAFAFAYSSFSSFFPFISLLLHNFYDGTSMHYMYGTIGYCVLLRVTHIRAMFCWILFTKMSMTTLSLGEKAFTVQ